MSTSKHIFAVPCSILHNKAAQREGHKIMTRMTSEKIVTINQIFLNPEFLLIPKVNTACLLLITFASHYSSHPTLPQKLVHSLEA